MLQSINVLILENEVSDFELIYYTLEEKLNSKVKLSPKPGYKASLSEVVYFNEKLVQVEDFKKIIDIHKNVDLFILDVGLKGDKDDIGIKFADFLFKNEYKNDSFEIIFVSDASLPRDLKRNEKKISKTTENFQFRIVDIINEIFFPIAESQAKQIISKEGGINEPTIDDKSDIKSSTDVPPIVNRNKLKGSANKIKENISKFFKHGLYDGVVKIAYGFDTTIRRIIHIGICIMFYLLLSASIIYGTTNVYKSFDLMKESEKLNEKITIKTFEPAESIFIYFLPLIILVGLYNYYISNTSMYLINGNKEKINEMKSVKSINMSKMIFLSSLISFVLIKFTEKIFFEDIDISLVVSGVMLLLILIFYLLFLHKIEHDSDHNTKNH